MSSISVETLLIESVNSIVATVFVANAIVPIAVISTFSASARIISLRVAVVNSKRLSLAEIKNI